MPGIIEGAKDGKGRGKQVIAGKNSGIQATSQKGTNKNPFFLALQVARTCSLILIVLDVLRPLTHKKILEDELEGFGIRLNKEPPNIHFKKKDKGGINMQAMVLIHLFANLICNCLQTFLFEQKQQQQTKKVPQTQLDLETVRSVLGKFCRRFFVQPKHQVNGKYFVIQIGEYKIHNADLILRCDASVDDLIDIVEGNRIYIPCIYCLNKIDQISIEELDVIYKIPHCIPISAHHKWNFDDLLEKIWDYLRLIRM